MKFCNLLIISAFLFAFSLPAMARDGAGKNASQDFPDQLDTRTARLSYTVGMDMGQSLRKLGQELNVDLVVQALRDAYLGNELLLTREQAAAIKKQFIRQRRQKMIQEARAKRQKVAAENRAKGQAFLAKNAKKEGVKTTPTGLQYKVLKEGHGPSPDANDRVTVHYTGTLIDGTVFDSSRKRGKPATFALNQVIEGWTEGLQLMHEGGRFKFFIPAKLAYGMQGAGGVIEPGATLIFDVKLLKVEQVENTSESAGTAGKQ